MSDNDATMLRMGLNENEQGLKSKVVRLVLEHFQATFNKRFGQGFIDKVQWRPAHLLWRYFWLDFLICNFAVAPAVIAFWRGSWDFSLIYMQEIEYLKVGVPCIHNCTIYFNTN